MFQTEHHNSALTNPRRTENIRLEPSKTNPSLLVSLSKCYPIPLISVPNSQTGILCKDSPHVWKAQQPALTILVCCMSCPGLTPNLRTSCRWCSPWSRLRWRRTWRAWCWRPGRPGRRPPGPRRSPRGWAASQSPPPTPAATCPPPLLSSASSSWPPPCPRHPVHPDIQVTTLTGWSHCNHSGNQGKLCSFWASVLLDEDWTGSPQAAEEAGEWHPLRFEEWHSDGSLLRTGEWWRSRGSGEEGGSPVIGQCRE